MSLPCGAVPNDTCRVIVTLLLCDHVMIIAWPLAVRLTARVCGAEASDGQLSDNQLHTGLTKLLPTDMRYKYSYCGVLSYDVLQYSPTRLHGVIPGML